MKEEYYKAIEVIKKLPKIPSIKEWNQKAKKEKLLSSKGMRFISGLSWKNLCKKVRQKTVKKA